METSEKQQQLPFFKFDEASQKIVDGYVASHSEYERVIRRGCAAMLYGVATAELYVYRQIQDDGKVLFICENAETAHVIKAWFEIDSFTVMMHAPDYATDPAVTRDQPPTFQSKSPRDAAAATAATRELFPQWATWKGDVIITTTQAIGGVTIPEMVHALTTSVATYWRVVDTVVNKEDAISNKPKKIIPVKVAK